MANGMTSMMVANSFAFFPMLLGANQLASWLTLRSRRLEYELMLPVDRRSYVRQLGAALALGHFQLWGVICATIAVWWLL